MKYIKTLNEAKYTSAFQKMNKLVYNDQISGRKSLSKTLAEDLGFNPKKEFTEGVGFDSTSLYDVKSGKTIMEDALSGKYTYDEILANAKDWYKKNESVDEAAQLVDEETGKVVKLPYKTKDFRGDPMTVKGFTEPHKSSSSGRIQTDKGEYFPGVAGVKIIGHKFESVDLNEAKKLDIGDKGVDYNDNVVEIIAIGNYNKIAKMLKKETGNDPEDYGYEKAPGNYYLTKNIEATEGNVGDVAMYPVKYDPNQYWGLDPLKESLNEAKKFKPGDKWSNDFDYEGMLKYALKTSIKTPIKTLNKLFDSATDVNYHTPFRNLGIAIDWIEDGDKEGAKDYMDSFIEDIKKEIKG